ncbi:hypothetical protein NQ315_002327 [Exocentrus adspersus]|uniref:Uncharacterized protein n=1 Tax=Exocentrus adspersus TaxID=1586481 RepID=A0AAV8VTE4_9CUCU|nr:hypothetical protein NQ315_002327 [Exocentrus adspersus]
MDSKIVYLFAVASLVKPGLFQNNSETLDIYKTAVENLHRHMRLTANYYTDYPDNGQETNATYDFIVIGSGPSGSVMANRLSEIPRWKVLLLEAGDEPSVITEIPFVSGALQFTNYNWGYKAEKQEGFCRGCSGGSLKWPHGKVLGGGTNINYMIQVRGNRIDYDRWAAMGNPGWSFDDVLPYFLKSEDAHIEKQDEEYHRRGGYLSVSDVPVRTESVRAFVEAAQEAGHPYVDYNGKSQLGVSYVQGTLRNGRRCSAEKAFLRPVRSRKNLRILTKARVVQILINPDTKEAYGVRYTRNKKYHTAIARKEVILSAGGLNSPQLLMLSGVGPRDHLEELGIPVVKDLPVGQKMYDHATFSGVLIQVNDSSIVFNQEQETLNPQTYIDFLVNGKGTFTSLGKYTKALTYIKTNASTDPDPSYPDIELIYVGGSLNTDKGLIYRRIFNVPQDMYDVIWKPFENKGLIQIFPMLVHPRSYGYIRLKSKNPFHWPRFYANFLSDPENHDVKTFVAAVREIERIIQSPSMRKYGAALVRTQIPGCEQYDFGTDAYWECAVRTITGTFYHQVATCKMGPPEDPEAVVDPKLRVYGVKNLRVVDTSVIPLPVTAHTTEPAYMVGEKASDLVKEFWGKKRPSGRDERRPG